MLFVSTSASYLPAGIKDREQNVLLTKKSLKLKMNLLIRISRIIVGLVFVFSGFVKAVDPLGSTYKFIDYFNAFNMSWLEPAALPFSIILSGSEFLIGICLLLFIQNKLANWGALIFMGIFTPLTLWLALENPVQDCGCFGDAIILTNWQTFYKNIVILVFVIISFIYKDTIKSWMSFKSEWTITFVTAIIITLFSCYNLRHLPVIDFRPYKTGTYIPDGMIIPEDAPANIYKQDFTLLDTISGKEITIDSDEYMNDSTYWMTGTSWTFVSSSDPVLVKAGYVPPIHDFSITSLYGEDITDLVLSDPGYTFILVSWNLKKYNTRFQEKINLLHRKTVADNHKIICLSSVSAGEIEQFKTDNNITYDFYITDPITLKTIIRANPGLLILHEGTIISKWNARDIPDYETISMKYLKR